MITTVCMNPSFDKTASVKALSAGTLNRLHDVRVDVGGKGINVAVVLKRLGVSVRCIGCLGEANEASFRKLIEKEGLPFEYLSVPGETRTNLKLMDESNHTITEFNEPGVTLNETQLEQFLQLLSEKTADSEYVVISGRRPAGCDRTTYQRCMQSIAGKKCILDTTGDSLLHGIKERPYLIKPNLPEIEFIMKKDLRTLRSLRDAALFLMDYGAQNVLISMGKLGAMLVTPNATLFSPAVSVEVRSTVGAGDAMVGGVLAGLSKGAVLTDAFRWGVAAGAASVMTDGTQLLRKNDFETLLPKVTVQEV